MTWGRATLALAVIASGGVGCGDRDLWDRYRAERALWWAERDLDRIVSDSTGADPAGDRRVADALARIVRRFPPPAGTPAPGYRRDVAELSGRAALGLARLEQRRGREAQAAEIYARARRDYGGVLRVALPAAVGRAEALAAAGRGVDAARVFEELAADFPPVDPERGRVLVAVLEAPPRAAALFVDAGARTEADRVWRDAVVRYRAALGRWTGTAAAAELALRLVEAHGALGELDASLAALRDALDEPKLGAARSTVLLGLAERSLGGGRPDSALVYTRWAEHDLADMARGRAMLLSATAWETKGMADSALAAYQRFVDAFPQFADSAALARFRRGDLLERIGRWDQARSEFRNLAAAFPDHALGFAALVRIVQHHARHGEGDLAAFEGRRALVAIDRVIERYRDPGVQALARRARAELVMALEPRGRRVP